MPAASIQVSDLLKIGTPSFQALVNGDPNLQSEWSHVVSHILADFNAGLVKDVRGQVTDASIRLEASMEQFAGAVGPENAGKSIDASVQLVATNFTSSGAAQVIGGLAQMGVHAGADAATPIVQNAAKAMTGSILSSVIGVAGAGLAASGVGAAVGVGISLVASVFSSLFGSPAPPPYQIGGCGLNDKPRIVNKYVWTWGVPVPGGPGNPLFRKFPDRANKADAPWFTGYIPPSPHGLVFGFGPQQKSWGWAGNPNGHRDEWYGCFTSPIDQGKRAIDQAMYDIGTDGNYANAVEVSVFRQIEQEVLAAAINGVPASQLGEYRRFLTAFARAWKSNRELGLNGLKMQPDWQVLQSVVAMWNQANGPQSTVRVAPSNAHLLPDDPKIAPPRTMNSYVQWLLAQTQYLGSMSSGVNSDGSITLNTGKINDITVGGLIPAGSLHLLKMHIVQHPAAAKKIKLLLPNSPQAWARLQAGVAQLKAQQAAQKPKRRYFFGATLAGTATGALAGGPIGAVAGAAAGGAVDLLRAHHEKEGKWL